MAKNHAVAGTNPSAVASFGSKDRAGFGGVTNYTRQLTNVAAGQVNVSSTDAVNGSQLFAVAEEVGNNGTQIATLHDTTVNHEGRITALENRQNNIGNEIHATNQRMNKLGASSAALSGLHPLDFNRNDKASYAVSYGNYRNANAVALGAFYRPNERVMIGAGMTLGSENQYTLNIAFKTGKGSDYIQEAKDAQSRISKLEALVNQLVEEVELSKQSK
ncbi:MAG: YadA-like family protein [Veillonella atypica]